MTSTNVGALKKIIQLIAVFVLFTSASVVLANTAEVFGMKCTGRGIDSEGNKISFSDVYNFDLNTKLYTLNDSKGDTMRRIYGVRGKKIILDYAGEEFIDRSKGEYVGFMMDLGGKSTKIRGKCVTVPFQGFSQ